MEMKRINENTIRVSIGNDDLVERGITFLDLLGNQKQIEHFFYSILEEVDVDEQFQETDSVTFQVLPNHDGLELFISKNLPMGPGDDEATFTGEAANNEFTDFIKDQFPVADKEKSENVIDDELDFVTSDMLNKIEMVYRLDNFESLIVLAKNVTLHNVLTDVYKMKQDYYLKVTFYSEESSDHQIKNDAAQLYEYAHHTNVTGDILEEYAELIMDKNALALARYYFK